MKRWVCFLGILYNLFACSSVHSVDEPDPELIPDKTQTETEILLGVIPDSIQLGKSIQFPLRVIQNTPGKLFNLSIDTTGWFKLEIDDKRFNEVTTLLPELNYNVKFTPKEEGYAGIIFTVIGEQGDSCTKTIEIYTYSPQPSLEFSSIPDTVGVGQPVEFRLIIRGATGEEYTLKVDTLIPEFRIPLSTSGSDRKDLLHRGVDLKINGRPLTDSVKLRAGYSNIFRFSEPQAIGDYHLIFGCSDKRGNTVKTTRTLHVCSPEKINIQFYKVDPLNELHIDKEDFYETLNRDYTVSPLSSIFQDKEIDSVAWHIHPREINVWSNIGKGLIFHIGQKGNNEFYFPADAIIYDEAKAPLKPEIDGRETKQSLVYSGFHGILFFYQKGRPYEASVTYRLTAFDRWGQKTSIDFPIYTY